ncbi:hypothetical protein B0H13DRAFT_1943373 [Mycena leptocephala]|nr:hypothetical protein B0H13DRAFT_1943373 [Mycena leptocephala]
MKCMRHPWEALRACLSCKAAYIVHAFSLWCPHPPSTSKTNRSPHSFALFSPPHIHSTAMDHTVSLTSSDLQGMPALQEFFQEKEHLEGDNDIDQVSVSIAGIPGGVKDDDGLSFIGSGNRPPRLKDGDDRASEDLELNTVVLPERDSSIRDEIARPLSMISATATEPTVAVSNPPIRRQTSESSFPSELGNDKLRDGVMHNPNRQTQT